MSLTTEQVRAKLLDYCMGILPVSEEAQVERALLEHDGLAGEAQRIRDLMGVAKRADALEWTTARSEANFAAIAAALGSGAGARSAEQPEAAGAAIETVATVAASARGARRGWGWLVAAAALFAGIAGGFTLLRDDSPVTPTATAERVVRASEAAPGVAASPAQRAVVAEVDVWASLPRTGSRPDGFPGSVFANASTDWRAQAEQDWTVYLASGVLLVEWMPKGSEHLVVRTPRETIQITGTVFAVEVTREATEVSVIEGAAVVGHIEGANAGERTEVIRGGRWRSDTGASAVSGAVSTAAGLRVDLAAHRAWMAARREVEPSTKRTAASGLGKVPLAPQAATSPSREPALSTLADEALARGEHSLAATLLEQWVERAPAPSTRRAAQLDLARIYLYELKQPERGAEHLRSLIAGSPSDRLALTLQSELCSLRLPEDTSRCEAK